MSIPRRRLPLPWLGLLAVVALLLASSSPAAEAFSTGQFRHSGSPDVGGATCANCHGDEQGAAVSIDVPTSMEAGESATIHVTVTGGPGAVAGFNAATRGLVGSIAPTDPAVQLVSGEATHRNALPFEEDRAVFSFAWTAPAEPTTVEWYIAAVSADGGGTTAGDAVATTSASITVTAPTATPEPAPTTRRPTITVVPTPTLAAAKPVEIASGPFGFGIDPEPAPPTTFEANTSASSPPPDGLAATGRNGDGPLTIATVLVLVGATCIVSARRLP